MKNFFLPVAIALLLIACKPQDAPLFERLSPDDTGVTFNNLLTDNDTMNILDYTYYYNGGGVGIGDVNNDGLADIYFTGNEVTSKLYLNRGNWQFEDVTDRAGVRTDRWARGVAMVDVNADGRLDLYVSAAGTTRNTNKTNLLFINNGNGADGNPTFTESAAAYGLADTGHTVQTAFFDYDRDGDLDAYLLTNAIEAESFSPNFSRRRKTNGEGLSTDRLYRNEGNGPNSHPVFRNVSRAAGISTEGYGLGIAVGDLNADGWPDVYCANDFLPTDLVWINNRNGTFTNRAADYLKHQSYNSMGTDIADFNNDGLPDIVTLDMAPPDSRRDKTVGSGAVTYDKYYYDLKIGYEPQVVRNTLQLNNGPRPDLPGDSAGTPSFSEIGELAGVSRTDWSWSALFADFDNDGYRDLFITNGYGRDVINLDHAVYHDQLSMEGDPRTVRARQWELAKKLPATKLPNYLYRNNGNLTFTDQSAKWGMDLPTLSNGAAYADLDNDGDLDLVINNINDPAGLYRNRAADQPEKSDETDQDGPNRFLRVRFAGPPANRQGLGAKLRLGYGGRLQVHEQATYRGFQSTVDGVAHFGLGKADRVDSVEITWPDGKYQLLRDVKAGQTLSLDYRNAGDAPVTPARRPIPLLAEVSGACGIAYAHRENDFVDFKNQLLLPQQYSRNGPGIAVGDVNGDGLDDFFVGGASGYAGKLFVQAKGTAGHPGFRSLPVDREGKAEEDMGALLFDADRDGDPDLYVVSGGNEFPASSPLYQDRLYRNDGAGNFTKDSLALPAMLSSGASVSAADYDRDGDLDLYVGTRITPGAYPYVSRSYLLRNDSDARQGIRFTDVTDEIAPALRTPGLITSALWTDFDNDGWTDLVVTGEWMPVSFFKNTAGKLAAWDADEGKIASGQPGAESSAGAAGALTIRTASGWWNSLVSGDFDNDGDLDYVAGNLGLNSKYKASPAEPVRLYASDYDKNGTLDPVLTYYLPGPDGKRASYPTASRDNFMVQMPFMRKRFTLYEDYGNAKAEDLFTEEELKRAYKVRGEHLQTSYFENRGGGKFRLSVLPVQAQFAPVFGMLSNDYDGDGNLDLLLTGNSYSTEVQTGQYDALTGLYLKGDGKGGFLPLPARQSGFLVEGDAKALAELMLPDGKPLILSAQNAGKLLGFAPNPAHPAGKPVHIVPLGPEDAAAEVSFAGGRKRRVEVYYGSTYLSQSSRAILLPEGATACTVIDYRGRRRELPLPASVTGLAARKP